MLRGSRSGGWSQSGLYIGILGMNSTSSTLNQSSSVDKQAEMNLFKILHIPSWRRSHTFSLPVSSAVLTYCTASNSHNPAIWLVNVVSESKNGIVRNEIFMGVKNKNRTTSLPLVTQLFWLSMYMFTNSIWDQRSKINNI